MLKMLKITVYFRARSTTSPTMHSQLLRRPLRAARTGSRLLHMMSPLPYAASALSVLSPTTVRHHRAIESELVNGLNSLIAGTPFEHHAVEEIVVSTASDAAHAKIFNHATEVWNHQLYWARLLPGPAERRSPAESAPADLIEWVDKEFSSFDGMVEEMVARSMGLWGSGWTWLVLERESLQLKVVNSFGPVHPLAAGFKPLLAIDLWEHAYLLEGGGREAYVRAYLSAVDWAAVSADLLLAMKGADDEQKLKYVTRLAMKEMRQLRHVMINHESVTLKEPLVLDDLGLSRKAEEHPVDEIERATAEMARKLSAEGK